MKAELKADLARYRTAGDSWRLILANPAVWALIWYRFGNWIYKGSSPRAIRLMLKPFHWVGYIFMEAFLQMALDPGAQIGPGLHMTHSGGIRLHPDVRIGRNCSLAHQVTIGAAGLGKRGVPVIGDDVYIGTGAVIVGAIEVGAAARIAANSFVNVSVPAGATAMGVPAKIVKVRKAAEK